MMTDQSNIALQTRLDWYCCGSCEHGKSTGCDKPDDDVHNNLGYEVNLQSVLVRCGCWQERTGVGRKAGEVHNAKKVESRPKVSPAKSERRKQPKSDKGNALMSVDQSEKLHTQIRMVLKAHAPCRIQEIMDGLPEEFRGYDQVKLKKKVQNICTKDQDITSIPGKGYVLASAKNEAVRKLSKSAPKNSKRPKEFRASASEMLKLRQDTTAILKVMIEPLSMNAILADLEDKGYSMTKALERSLKSVLNNKDHFEYVAEKRGYTYRIPTDEL